MDRSSRLLLLCQSLVDQHAARITVEPQQRASGFWFGGGNMVRTADGHLYLAGRFRNAGDSRSGVAAGLRGAELAIFRSSDGGRSFGRMMSWDKASLHSPTGNVLSIEGSCLRVSPDGVELFVSTEKQGVPYPERVASFLKPGTGVWTIDVIRADSIEGLRDAAVCPLFQSDDPQHLHVKDPFLWPTAAGDRMGFCSHPYNWTSSNTGVADIPEPGGVIRQPEYGVFPRGTTWDVAMARGTCVFPVPAYGPFADQRTSILFYCGGECVRPLQEHAAAVSRPRGYSCEELGGAAWFTDDRISGARRLSDLLPLFVSPYGSGCSRYTDVLDTPEGCYVTWQQSQSDLSQPLVMNFVPRDRLQAILES